MWRKKMERSVLVLEIILAILVIGELAECRPEECCEPPCHENATCVDKECLCNDGYFGTGIECGDLDECINTNICGDNSDCINIIGSYKCVCHDGFKKDGDNCVPVITEPPDCESGECCDPACHENATCNKKDCLCNDGFDGDGLNCENIDECEEGTHDCDQRVVCVDTIGSYECRSSEGGGVVLCENADKDHLAELCAKRSALESDIHKLRLLLYPLDAELHRILREIKRRFKTLSDLQDKLAGYQKEWDDQIKQLEKLYDKVTAGEMNRSDYESAANDITNSMAEIRDHIESTEDDIEDAREELGEKEEKRLSDLEKEVDRLRQRIKNLNRRLAQQQERLDFLNKMCEELGTD